MVMTFRSQYSTQKETSVIPFIFSLNLSLTQRPRLFTQEHCASPVISSLWRPADKCCGSGSVGSVCFWDSRIRGTDPDPAPSSIKEKVRKSWIRTILCDFLWLFIFEKWGTCIYKKVISKKNLEIKIILLLLSWRSLTKIAESGTGSGSVWQRYGSVDPQHCCVLCKFLCVFCSTSSYLIYTVSRNSRGYACCTM